jgi:hypothetical protein
MGGQDNNIGRGKKPAGMRKDSESKTGHGIREEISPKKINRASTVALLPGAEFRRAFRKDGRFYRVRSVVQQGLVPKKRS